METSRAQRLAHLLPCLFCLTMLLAWTQEPCKRRGRGGHSKEEEGLQD